MDNINDEIDVEAIMKRVKESMEKKTTSSSLSKAYDSAGKTLRSNHMGNTSADHDYLLGNWNVMDNVYKISSHRKLVGPVFIKGRQIINGEVKRYVDPMFNRQAEYNASILRYIDGSLEDMNVHMVGELNAQYAKTDKRLDIQEIEADRKINTMYESISKKVDSIIPSINTDINNKAWLASILEGKINKGYSSAVDNNPKETEDLNYLDFENRFRGTREDITQRQSAFIGYYQGCVNVLDIGCGRGEFLELMRNNGIEAQGIDADETMVQYCLSRNLKVKNVDAITYLNSLDDGSLDGIFTDQVVEHLEPAYLANMLKLCHQKIKTGGHIFIETVNPTSFTSFVNFYIDMTHQRPIHPQTLSYLVEAAGFSLTEVKFISPVADGLKKIRVRDSQSDNEKETLSVYNENIDKLNHTLFGEQDYYVVGRK